MRILTIFLSILLFTACAEAKDCTPKPIIPNDSRFEDMKRMPRGCPGYDVEDPGILNLKMFNGIKVNIPREYILYSKEPDGNDHTQNMEMMYPDMSFPKPEKKHVGDVNKINISIQSPLKNTNCYTGRCLHNSIRKYERNALNFFYKGESTKIEDYLPEEVFYDDKIGMHYFKKGKKTAYSAQKTIYFQGDIKKPDYWFKCQSICQVTLWINEDRLVIDYFFNEKELLQHHDEIKEKLISKINEFIEK